MAGQGRSSLQPTAQTSDVQEHSAHRLQGQYHKEISARPLTGRFSEETTPMPVGLGSSVNSPWVTTRLVLHLAKLVAHGRLTTVIAMFECVKPVASGRRAVAPYQVECGRCLNRRDLAS